MTDHTNEAKRHRLTRVCMLSAHDKCMGYFDLPVSGRVSCDCACHETLPTLFTDLAADEQGRLL